MISVDKCVSVCVRIIEKCKGFWNENIFMNGLVSVSSNTRLFYKEKCQVTEQWDIKRFFSYYILDRITVIMLL